MSATCEHILLWSAEYRPSHFQKAASPMVIAQCYQNGPATKIDPLLMIADAKRVCDNLVRMFYLSLVQLLNAHPVTARKS